MARTAREPHLDIPSDKLGFIILKAREYDVKESDTDPDEGSNPTDDGIVDEDDDREGLDEEDEPLGDMQDKPKSV